MRITTIKLLNDGVNLDWQTNVGDDVVKHSVKNGAEPTPAFRDAVDALKDDAQKSMELPAAWMDTVTVSGLSASYDDDGTLEVALAFKKKFKSGRVKGYSTPQLRQSTDAGQTGGSFMSEGLRLKVMTAIKEAERYVEGSRAQTKH